jgi:hypothetical protein
MLLSFGAVERVHASIAPVHANIAPSLSRYSCFQAANYPVAFVTVSSAIRVVYPCKRQDCAKGQ